ncbi:hypothetical protein U9M48_023519 [Paspalum notatum var. saurae]|uniref:Calmodulin-binding domain-containing protein n=1 Tax=Paspalum notatum var. saurae TaxID=547442 RepID=A0AAQ3TNJ3_PASNO
MPRTMNGGTSLLAIYGTPTESNKRKHKGQTFQSAVQRSAQKRLYAMATSSRELQPNARANRGIRNMSPGLKPSEPEQGLRRARSVPTSPDRRASPSPASSSSNACRPSSSFNTRTISSRSTSGLAASTHGKTLHSTSYKASAKQTNTMRKKAEKPGATSVWPPALATPNTSSKDMTRAAKSPSTMQWTNLSTRPSIQKTTTSSVKPKTQKTVAGPLGAGKIQAVSSTRAPGAITKKKTGAENFISIQRTRSVPARQKETPKIEEQDVDLLMEFDETESISTSSIEEHLQERLPDPVDLQSVAVTSKPCSSQEEYKNEDNAQELLEDKQDGKDNELNAGANNAVGIKSGINIVKGITSETELKEVIDETELKEDISATELKESADETELNEAVSETANEAIDKTKLKEANCETALKEAANETESRDAVAESELIVQEEAKTKEEKIMLPAKPMELAQRWRKDDGRSNEATEEGRSKPAQERKNKVMALVGRFETAMSGRD